MVLYKIISYCDYLTLSVEPVNHDIPKIPVGSTGCYPMRSMVFCHFSMRQAIPEATRGLLFKFSYMPLEKRLLKTQVFDDVSYSIWK